LILIIALFICTTAVSQDQDIIRDHKWLIMMKRELDLTKSQIKKLTAIDNYIMSKVYYYDHNYTKKNAAISARNLFSQQRKKILSVLTQEQRPRAIMILDQKPRRGVTDMPNERTGKQ
jgi:hypothetical protein